MIELNRALEVAIASAKAAGSLLAADFHRPEGPRGGGDKAEADVEAERLIRDRLLHAFPAWGYLGEETGAQAGRADAPVWVVDPNDGTRDYLLGKRGSSVSIGGVHAGKPVLGVVFAFAYPDDEGDLFAWAEGCGPATRNGSPVVPRLADVLRADSIVLLSSNSHRDFGANIAAAAPARFRAVPSIAHRLALVGMGEADGAVSLYAPCAWDYCAGHALVSAAGGRLVDQDGRDITYDADGTSRTKQAFAGSTGAVGELRRRPWRRAPRDAPRDPTLRHEPGRSIVDASLLARAQGCLLGQVAGDSLGAAVEGMEASAIATEHPAGLRTLADRHGLLGGQPTDDSEMALALARSIIAQGRFEEAHVLASYRAWLASGPFSLGRATLAGLSGEPILDSQANGSLMRVSPLGIFAHSLPPGEAAGLAMADSRLTHPHAVPSHAAAAYVVAIGHALRTGDGPGAFEAALAWARGHVAEASVIEALERARDAPRPTQERMGWVLIALQNGFFDLLHATSLEEGIVSSVARGGDTDTNAAIAGALLCAVHGRQALPPQWRRMILTCRADPLCARAPRPREYWPTHVLQKAEWLLLAGRDC